MNHPAAHQSPANIDLLFCRLHLEPGPLLLSARLSSRALERCNWLKLNLNEAFSSLAKECAAFLCDAALSIGPVRCDPEDCGLAIAV